MKRIVIVGMGRSGTTFLTEFLGKCGVVLGEVNWAHEHELARLINDTLLAQEFGAHPGLPYGRLPAEEIEPAGSWRQLAHCFIRFMDAEAQAQGTPAYWAFKDPRTTILHRIWLEHFDVIVGMFRSPNEVAASYLGQRWVKGWHRWQIVLDYWKRFNQSLLYIRDTYGSSKPLYVLNYNGDIAAQTWRLSEHLGLEITPEAAALFTTSRYHYRDQPRSMRRDVARVYDALVSMEILHQ